MDTKTDPKMKLTENKISPEKNATSNESQDSKGNKSSSDVSFNCIHIYVNCKSLKLS